MVELQLLNKGFKADGMYAGLRADLALVTCDVEAVAAGVFTTIIVAPAPVVYCKKVLETSKTVISRRTCENQTWKPQLQTEPIRRRDKISFLNSINLPQCGGSEILESQDTTVTRPKPQHPVKESTEL